MAAQYVFLALLVLSAQGFSEAKSIQAYDERGLVEVIDKIIKEVVDLAHSFLDNSMKVIQELYDQLQGAAKEEFEKALEQLGEIIDQARAELKEIIAQLEGLGNEVRQCVANEEANIVELGETTQKETAACRKALTDEANRVFNNAFATVVQSLSKIGATWERFENCPNILCKIGVMADIPNVIQEIKANVNRQIAEIQSFVRTEFPKFTQCNQEATVKFLASIAEIKSRIEACVNNIGN